MNANEPSGIHSFAEVGDGFTQHVAATTRMQTAVVVRCFDPVNLLGRKQDLFFPIFNQEARWVGLRLLTRPQTVQDCSKLFLSKKGALAAISCGLAQVPSPIFPR